MSVRPRTDELLESILWSFEAFVMPDLRDDYAVSIAHTIRNLLKLVALRVRLEGPALHEHRKELRALLARIGDFADAHPSPVLGDLRERIDLALEQDGPDDVALPGVIDASEKVGALRWALDGALRTLQGVPDDLRRDEGYLTLRQAIRDCLAHQLEREEEWMSPAFSGRRR